MWCLNFTKGLNFFIKVILIETEQKTEKNYVKTILAGCLSTIAGCALLASLSIGYLGLVNARLITPPCIDTASSSISIGPVFVMTDVNSFYDNNLQTNQTEVILYWTYADQKRNFNSSSPTILQYQCP